MKELTKQNKSLTDKHKLRIQIQNLRGILSRKKRGIKSINSREWEVRSRNPESDIPERIMVCDSEKVALAEYQKYIKNKLEYCVNKLRNISPDDPYLS
jgi:hypothetical protein